LLLVYAVLNLDFYAFLLKNKGIVFTVKCAVAWLFFNVVVVCGIITSAALLPFTSKVIE